MKLTIDNLQGQGPQDYTAALDGTKLPKVERKGNQPAELQFSLVANSPQFVIPVVGARVALGKTNGSDVFTGYVVAAPQYEYLGWGEQGPVYRYNVAAQSDEALLNQKALPNRPLLWNGARVTRSGNWRRIYAGRVRHERGAGCGHAGSLRGESAA